MPTTGEKPGIGRYVCLNCGEDVNLDDTDDTLPPYGGGQVLKYKFLSMWGQVLHF